MTRPRRACGPRASGRASWRSSTRRRRGRPAAPRRPRGDVLRGPEDEAGLRRHRAVGPVEARDAEVEHLDVVGVVAAAHEHHVLGLEIAVDDALVVGLAHGVADLQNDVERPRQGQRRRGLVGPGGGEGREERDAVEVLHHQVELAADAGLRRRRERARHQHLDDVGVHEPARDLGLAVEARHELGVPAQLPVEDLHRDVALDPALEGPVDAAHRADADQVLDADLPAELEADVGVAISARERRRARARERGAVAGAEQDIRVVPLAAGRTALSGGRFHRVEGPSVASARRAG